MADTKLVDNCGNVYRSWTSAIRAMRLYPNRTFFEESLSMEGTTRKDVTGEVRQRMTRGLSPYR